MMKEATLDDARVLLSVGYFAFKLRDAHVNYLENMPPPPDKVQVKFQV